MTMFRTLSALACSAALFTLGTGTIQASSFDYDQYFAVSDPYFYGSQNVIYYYNNGFTDVSPFQYGDYYFYFALPYNADIGLFHYSYLDGRYTEAVYLNDYPL